MPGIFEMMLISHTPESLTEWHRRFIELFEALYETGYSLDYQQKHPTPAVRYLPVGKAIDAHPMALPTDKLEVVLDQFEVFARRAMPVPHGDAGPRPRLRQAAGQLHGDGHVGRARHRGRLCSSRSRKKDALEIKREAESHGMVNWMMNVQSTRGQCSCSCCGCCCHAMRMVNEFNAPGLSAPPHFLPRLDGARCTHCGKCAQELPDGRDRRRHRAERTTRICRSAASAAGCVRWRATGSGRWRWSRSPTIASPTAVGSR